MSSKTTTSASRMGVDVNLTPLYTPRFDAEPLRDRYEASAIATLATIWRYKWLIFLLVALIVGLAAFALNLIGKRYTAEALIQFDFARSDPIRAANPTPPTATIDGAVLVESEARVIRSRPLARAVAQRLGLDKDSASLTARPENPALMWLRSIFGSTQIPTPADLAASELMEHLTVTNDTRSYLIRITFTAKDPATAARIANAFAGEYLESKRIQRLLEAEAAANVELVWLSASYGARHPSVVSAAADLADARAQLAVERRAFVAGDVTRFVSEGLTPAQPIAIPSGPRTTMVLGLSVIGALAAAITLALLLDRRDRGFRTAPEILQETGVRCFGIVPHRAGNADVKAHAQSGEAISAISIAAGLTGVGPSHRVVMITSSVPREGKSFVASALAQFLVANGHRLLTIDLSPRTRSGGALTLEAVLEDEQAGGRFLDEHRAEPLSRLRRAPGSVGGQAISASPAFERFLMEARQVYDFVIIEAPPVLLLADAILLGRFADVVLYCAKWHSTPRGVVAAGLQRLIDGSVRTGGVILSDVNLKRRRYSERDQGYYFRRYKKFYELSA